MIRKRAVLLDAADIEQRLRDYESDAAQMPFLTMGTVRAILNEIQGFVVFELDDTENASVKAIFRERGGERVDKRTVFKSGRRDPYLLS